MLYPMVRMALAAALLAAPIAATAQQKIVIKMGWTSGAGETDPYAVGAREFKKALEARVGNKVDVQLFPNRQIGDEKPLIEGMRLGTVDGGIITNAVISQIEPAFQLNDLPFLFENEAQALVRAALVERNKAGRDKGGEATRACLALIELKRRFLGDGR